MKQTRIRLFGSVLMIIIIPMALFILGIWKNSDSYLTTQVLISGIAVLVIISFSMAFWVYSGIIRPLEKLQQAGKEITHKLAIPRWDGITTANVVTIGGAQYKVYNVAQVETRDGYPETEITLITPEMIYEVAE